MNVFLAFPFTQFIVPETGLVPVSIITFLSNLKQSLESEGFRVFLAHDREKWGKDLMTPVECTHADLLEMKNTDIVVAFAGAFPISGGVHIELGWASALGKPIILCLNEAQDYSPLVTGLHVITEVTYLKYTNDRMEELPLQILDLLQAIRDNQKSECSA